MNAADAYRDAWLAEMWAPVRELSREERAAAADIAAWNPPPVDGRIHKSTGRKSARSRADDAA